MAPTLIVPSLNSTGMAVISSPPSRWLEEFLEPCDPFDPRELVDPIAPEISPLLLERLDAESPFWFYLNMLMEGKK